MLIYWFTGQPGSGKTTLAQALKEHLRERFRQAVMLDGDEWRDVLVNTDYTPEGRRRNVRSAQRMAQKLVDDGIYAICAFVSPHKAVRDELKALAPVAEIYLTTTATRGREQYFVKDYEPPGDDALHLDTTDISIGECIHEIMRRWPLPETQVVRPADRGKARDGFALFIGRWQPWHDGHRWLIDRVLLRGKKVCIAVRDVPRSESNPFSLEEVMTVVRKQFQREIAEGMVTVIPVPDIDSVNIGRRVGYDIIEHWPPPDVENISATEIRRQLLTSYYSYQI